MIAIDDISYTVTALDPDKREIGSMKFYEVDGTCLKLAWAYLDKLGDAHLRQGIGEEILKLVKERYGMPIIAEDNDGIRKDDGSHLTGDAPGFVARMREKGLIEQSHREENGR